LNYLLTPLVECYQEHTRVCHNIVRNLIVCSVQITTPLTVSAWMFNCVGHYNHRYFMLFVVFMWMGTFYVVHCAWSRVFVLLHIDSVSVHVIEEYLYEACMPCFSIDADFFFFFATGFYIQCY